MRTIRIAAAALVVALLAAACGSDSSSEADGTSGGGASGDVTISAAWARTSPASAENGAAYMVLRSAEGDTLRKVEAPTTVAKTVELHETVKSMSGDATTMAAGGSSTTGGAMPETMTMKPIDELVLPKGEDVALEPGGYHVMLIGLAAPLETGKTIELTLTFDKAGTKTVEVPVRTSAP